MLVALRTPVSTSRSPGRVISDGDGKPLRGFIPEFYERKTQLWAFVPVPRAEAAGLRSNSIGHSELWEKSLHPLTSSGLHRARCNYFF